MKKSGMINSTISEVLSNLGHTDTFAIGDCGLPVPEGTRKIDLAVTLGRPGFMEVLKAVTADMKIEKLILAEEIKECNPDVWREMQSFAQVLSTENGTDFCIEFISHEELKRQTKRCKAVVRTGEATPYANVILQSACIF